ncbi:hypothetical protein JW964_24105 [candidate division KSB1 bacterium]|nr:hypothetical protein [candidate division KSB1 bacterium]
MYLFIGMLLGFLLIIFIFNRKFHWALRILLLFFLVILSGFFLLAFDIAPPVRGEEECWHQIAPWKHIILLIVMLLGMITNYFFEFLQARIKAKESAGQAKLPKFIWEKLVLPLLIAGILFGYFWGQHGKEPMGLAIIFISYQNGFFWQTILDKIRT